ncbi:hypothetical protein KEJ34_01695 [Candidatus Bathyarchaeota archaeon]|nr:hypothetical protein [Candidatus Bathyarchaeota archaeon]
MLFLFRLLSVGTGLVFTLLVTRNITLEEYGVYSNIGDTLSYFTLASAIIPFWVTRFTARGRQDSPKTGLIINLLVALASTAVYLITIPNILGILQVSSKYFLTYFVGVFLIVENHIQAVLEAIFYPKRPEMMAFGLLVLEIGKVSLGFLFIIGFRMGLIGVLFSLIASYLVQILFYVRGIRREILGRIRWDYAKRWFKASLINIYGIIGGRILMFANILLFVYSGELARAYYGASSAIASIVGYSSSLSFALYPKLLSEANPSDVSSSLKMILMFALPMCIGAIVLSEPLLLILNPLYAVAKPILILLSINALLSAASSVFDSIISGTERLDADEEISYRKMIGSRLFLQQTLTYAQAAVIVPLMYVILAVGMPDALTATEYLALINVLTNLSIIVSKYVIASRCLRFDIPWVSLIKYLSASLVMSLVLYLTPTLARLSMVAVKVLFGALVYFSLVLLVDKEARKMLKMTKDFASREISEKLN